MTTASGGPAVTAASRGHVGLVQVMLGFVEHLRGHGVVLPPDRVATMLQAVGLVDLLDRAEVAAATRTTLCSSPDEVAVHDAQFGQYFSWYRLPIEQTNPLEIPLPGQDPGADGLGEPGPPQESPHPTERLRSRPLRGLAPEEREEALRLLASLQVERPLRRVRRRTKGGHRLDPAATTRALVRTGGHLPTLRYREHALRPRRVVLLVDVSGSMRAWAEPNLRFAHALRHSHGAEVFTLATRLTRVSEQLSNRDVEAAVLAAGRTVPDWTGGTRLADGLNHLVDDWGRRGPLRGAVLVLMSDGLDTGDPEDFAAAMGRLARLVHKIVWIHPRAGAEGWQPATRALVAALPVVDGLVAGDSVDALTEAGRAIARPAGGGPAWSVGGARVGDEGAGAGPRVDEQECANA
ncbi:vWA domain-containing protein [Propionibacteriaceae bacterium Y1923]|uniref:vWA domain-containing protein n=1 Tax=Aestuariimicrobium sp. Y1814 TaxID=3418742 RepID=UPI003C17124B